MSGQSPPGSPTTSQRRRSSFAELFTPRSSITSSTTPPSTSVPSSLATPQHRRGLSISTSTKGLGLSGATSEQSPFTAFAKQRQASVSTASSTGSPEFRNSFGDEPAVVEEDDPASAPLNTPASPSFARRMSFGAQALRDVKQGSVGASSGGRRPSSSLFTWNENTTSSIPSPSPPGPSKSATARGEGFNWSDALRDKTKRSPSFSSAANPFTPGQARNRSSSVTAPEPPKEMPKPAPVPPPVPQRFNKPDHLGERMLRGEFMMD